MATIAEAAQQLRVSRITIRRWIKSGELEAYLDKTGLHGPQWIVADEAILRRLNPDQTPIEVLPPDSSQPIQMITMIKEHMIQVTEDVQRLNAHQQHLTQDLSAWHHDLMAEMAQLREQITRLETQQQQMSKRKSWWPWSHQ